MRTSDLTMSCVVSFLLRHMHCMYMFHVLCIGKYIAITLSLSECKNLHLHTKCRSWGVNFKNSTCHKKLFCIVVKKLPASVLALFTLLLTSNWLVCNIRSIFQITFLVIKKLFPFEKCPFCKNVYCFVSFIKDLSIHMACKLVLRLLHDTCTVSLSIL